MNRTARPPASQPGHWRPGYTLIELIVGMFASSLLLLGMASAIAITARSISPETSRSAVLKSADASGIIADEVQSAVHVPDQDQKSIRFALGDRDGDGDAETVRYEWDSSSGQLLRQYNDSVAASMMNNLTAFAIEPDMRRVSETLGGVVSQSAESTLEAMTSASYWSTWYLSPYEPCGQSVVISHADDVVLWSVTKVSLPLRRSSSYYLNEQVIVQIREAAGDGLPTSNVLAEATIPVSSLSTSYRWKTVTMTGAERLLPTQNICIVASGDDQVYGSAGRVPFATSGFSDPGSMLKFDYYDAAWKHDYDDSLYYRIKGTRHTVDSTSHEVVREYITGYNIDMTYDDDPTPVRRRIRLLNTPENVTAMSRLDFNSESPDETDIDYDGIADWTYAGDSTFSQVSQNSILPLTNGQKFQSALDNDFSGITTVNLHCRGTTYNASGGGAFMEIPFGADSSPQGLILVSVDRTRQGNQTVLVTAEDGSTGQTLALVRNLPDEIVELRIVIDAKFNQVAVWVNDVFQGRSTVTQPRNTATKRVVFGADGASAEFDFLSVRSGGE